MPSTRKSLTDFVESRQGLSGKLLVYIPGQEIAHPKAKFQSRMEGSDTADCGVKPVLCWTLLFILSPVCPSIHPLIQDRVSCIQG